MSVKKKTSVPEGQTRRTMLYSKKATEIILKRQFDLKTKGKKRSWEQVCNSVIEEIGY